MIFTVEDHNILKVRWGCSRSDGRVRQCCSLYRYNFEIYAGIGPEEGLLINTAYLVKIANKIREILLHKESIDGSMSVSPEDLPKSRGG
jgi:hypothetical protein